MRGKKNEVLSLGYRKYKMPMLNTSEYVGQRFRYAFLEFREELRTRSLSLRSMNIEIVYLKQRKWIRKDI